MKYFTKEWYADTLVADMCFQIKKSSKAEKFNEKYFLSLYNAQKKWFVRMEKYKAKQNKVKFDANAVIAAEKAYEASHQENISFVKENLPQSILERVADIRVLALGSAAYDVTDDIVKYCGQVDRRCERVVEEYEAQLEPLAERYGWEKVNTVSHIQNSAIELCVGDGNGNFAFATSKEYTGVPCRIDLIGAKVLRADDGLVGSAVAHYELLPLEDGRLYFAALCQKLDGSLIEFEAEMTDFEVI